jgi:hypothetical protein
MGILYLKRIKKMNYLGVTIRKININENNKKQNVSPRTLSKEILTLHRKLKKLDKKITTTYVIEKDNHMSKYHAHLMINYEDKLNLYNQLSRFIGGNIWEERKERLDTINGCSGKYGEVDTHFIYDEIGFLEYLNKTEQTKTLV